jgi:hypothetical protein
MTMIADRIEQFERPATTRPHLSRQRHVLRGHPVAEAAASVERAVQDLRAGVAMAFRALANGIEPRPAQAQSAAFYRASGQLWARSLGVDEGRVSRASVAAAFGAMAHGIDPDVAAEATLRFYRASGAI